MQELMGFPPLHSAHGGELDSLILNVHIFMLILFVGWTAFFIFALVRFRSSKSKRGDYVGVTSPASKYLEIIVVIVEAVLLLGFSIPLYAKRVNQFPPKGDAIEIRVVAQQFAWNIHYPGADGIFGKADIEKMDDATNPLGIDWDDPAAADDVWTVNQMYLPVNENAIIHLSSKDVIHCINLPTMRVKQDAIPGMVVPVWFKPIEIGDTEIACAQLCGIGHYRMRGELHVQSREDFDAWQAAELQKRTSEAEEGDFWE